MSSYSYYGRLDEAEVLPNIIARRAKMMHDDIMRIKNDSMERNKKTFRETRPMGQGNYKQIKSIGNNK